jgi:tetratricopeptide (TPR) repeat protein
VGVIRQIMLASSACVLLIAWPAVASAQEPIAPPREWREGLSELTTALAGTFGDEASDIEQALAKMSRALSAWDDAIRAFDARVSQTPDAPLAAAVQIRISAALTYAHRGHSTDALRHIEAAARLAPQRADVHLLRGLLLERSRLTGEATEAFQRAWSLDPASPVSAYHVVRSAAAPGAYVRADLSTSAPGAGAAVARTAMEAAYVRLLTAGAKATPVTLQPAGDPLGDIVLPPAAYTRAYAHLARGDYAEAIAEFQKAAATDPLVTDPARRSDSMRRAAGALKQGRPAEARGLIQSAGLLPASAEAHRVLGLVEWADRQYDASIEHLETAARINPRDERSRLALARVLSDAGRDADAVHVLEQTIRAFPESPLAHWSLGSQYERLNRLADARREYETAAEHAPARRDRLDAAIGRLAAGAADLAGAGAAFDRAVAADLNDPAIHKAMAGVLLQQDRSEQALVELLAALLLDPADAGAHMGVGQIYLNAGRHADAVGPLRRALELSPADTAARYALATSLMRLGRAQEAAREFERVEQEQRQAVAERRRAIDADVRREESGR